MYMYSFTTTLGVFRLCVGVDGPENVIDHRQANEGYNTYTESVLSQHEINIFPNY